MGTTIVSSRGKSNFQRMVESTGPNPVHKNKNIVTEGNIHSGQSDNGNYNSRGSEACFTVHPNDVGKFMGEFDWNDDGKGNTGTSHGKVFAYRGQSAEASLLQNILENQRKAQSKKK